MDEQSKALNLLKTALRSNEVTFRDGQWEAIDALVNKQERVLVVQRTGWGKSLVYFIATRILRDRGRGPTLIVSPLLALMRNQIETAKHIKIIARTINSTNEKEWPQVQRALKDDKVDTLLISPERLANDDFVTKYLLPISRSIGLIVVDEAHCISDWGHDFRPDYQRIVNVLQSMPDNIPVLGTTATATKRVIEDIKDQVGKITIHRGRLSRDTLALQTIRLPSQKARLAWLKEHINELPGTGIIYTLTKHHADNVANWLNKHDVVAHAYHSDVQDTDFKDSDAYRQYLEAMLFDNRIKVIVATSALGMGYDKPDLGFVIHYQAPRSIITYYQQVGRAGRGITHAVGILLSGHEDDNIQAFFRRSAFPQESWVRKILEILEINDGLSLFEIEQKVNLRKEQIKHVLKHLSVNNPAPVIKKGSKWLRTPVDYHMDHEKIQRLSEQREVEWKEVQDYINEQGCLMRFLTKKLDDEASQPCGKCASCLGKPVVDASFSQATEAFAKDFLCYSEIVLECRKVGVKVEERAERGRILSRWRDDGWGKIVEDDKAKGRFRDELVKATAEMILNRWQPDPPPAWITCVPSRRIPTLVPDFAKRLAERLGLPFYPVVTQSKDNEPQKEQQNSVHQRRNLDGVFVIREKIPDGAVLLVDDVVDSGWTLTTIAALLRKAESGPVWPFALVSSVY